MWELNVKLSKDERINEDIKAVFMDIVNQYEKLISQGPPLKECKRIIEVIPGIKPLCAIAFLPKYYQIQLKSDVENKNYLQAARQFSHELCHIYCDPRISNRFIEAICEISFLYFFEYLSELRRDRRYSDYKTKEIASIRYDWGEFSDIKNILYPSGLNHKKLSDEEKRKERNLQLITANELLETFQKDSNTWLLLADFGKFSKPQPNPGEYKFNLTEIIIEGLLDSASVSGKLKEKIEDILKK
ncbi:MAG: hypothetical protein ABIH18_07980 [Candidatus Omnitrophota bacterium]